MRKNILAIVILLMAAIPAAAQPAGYDKDYDLRLLPLPEDSVKVKINGKEVSVKFERADCKVGYFFEKNICSNIENNKAYLIRYQLQKRSGKNSLPRIRDWTRENYHCINCPNDPGFVGGTMLRKVVFDNALGVAFFLTYDMDVNLNVIEEDGKTLLDWLQEETEKTFEEAFETENERDKELLMQMLNDNMKYYNLFKNNGAMFTHELVAVYKQWEEQQKKKAEEAARKRELEERKEAETTPDSLELD